VLLGDQSNRKKKMPIDRKCRQEEEYSFEMNQMERINEHTDEIPKWFVISRKQ
jgi:hypothetical protein